jgi:hypothetical protein
MLQSITVHPTPTLNTVVVNPLVCIGGPSTISASGANSYSWNNGSTTSVTIINPAITTVYTVTGIYDNTGCNSSKTAMVSVFSPTFQTPTSASACIGGTVTLTAGGADTYTWNGVHQFPSIAVSPSVYTVYQVAATSSSLGPNGIVSCISSKTVGVSIYLNPTITAMATRSTICKNEMVDLVAQGGATYSWSTLQQGSLVSVQPPPTGQATYTVLGVDSAGCKGTASVTVKIFACSGIGEISGMGKSILEIFPNPNTGEFRIRSDQKIELTLTNAMGQEIRRTRIDERETEVSFSDLPSGVYFISGRSGNQVVREKIVVNR